MIINARCSAVSVHLNRFTNEITGVSYTSNAIEYEITIF